MNNQLQNKKSTKAFRKTKKKEKRPHSFRFGRLKPIDRSKRSTKNLQVSTPMNQPSTIFRERDQSLEEWELPPAVEEYEEKERSRALRITSRGEIFMPELPSFCLLPRFKDGNENSERGRNSATQQNERERERARSESKTWEVGGERERIQACRGSQQPSFHLTSWPFLPSLSGNLQFRNRLLPRGTLCQALGSPSATSPQPSPFVENVPVWGPHDSH